MNLVHFSFIQKLQRWQDCRESLGLLLHVVVALEYAIEAMVEMRDATGVIYIEDTFGAPRDGNNDIDQMLV